MGTDYVALADRLETELSEALAALRELEATVCQKCRGMGLVRVHSHEDYGVSFESELCESCPYGQALLRIDELESDLTAALSNQEKP